MNIALRKLAMLEQRISEQEERDRIQGVTTNIVDIELKNSIKNLMDKIQRI